MIPKIIHCCWFSGEPKPALFKRCMESWRKYCPAWEIREWDVASIRREVEPPRFFVEALKARKWAFASDWARFWAVSTYGGVYLDMDVELVAPIDDLVAEGGFFALSSDEPQCVDPGLGFAGERGNVALRAIVAKYETMEFDSACHLSQACPGVTMAVLEDFPNTRLLPARYFNPKGDCAGKLRISSDTRGIHHFAASWFNWKQWLAYKIFPKIGVDVGKVKKCFRI